MFKHAGLYDNDYLYLRMHLLAQAAIFKMSYSYGSTYSYIIDAVTSLNNKFSVIQ